MVTEVMDHTKNSNSIDIPQGSKDNHEKQKKVESIKNGNNKEINKSISIRLQKMTFTSMGIESVDQMRQRNTMVNKAGSQPKQGVSGKSKSPRRTILLKK